MEEERKKPIVPVCFDGTKAEKAVTFDGKKVESAVIFTDISKAKKPVYFDERQQENITEVTSNGELDKGSSEIVRPPTVEKKEEIINLTNYQLYPQYRRIYLDRDGVVDYERNEMEIKIVINEFGRALKDVFRIKCINIDKITKVIGRKYPDAILYSKKDADGVENNFREKCGKAQITRCYTDAGWQIIDGKHIYLHKGVTGVGMEVITPLMLPSHKPCSVRELETIWRKSLSIYKDNDVAAVLSLYSFLGVSYKLFDEAGFAPHFLLFMTGKTGSFKTTIAKLLFTQLADERYREFPRRIDADTVTSFERALVVSGVDTVTLIDDYSPAKSKQRALDMANKLESIVRMVGDGSTKSRSNVALDDCRGEGVRGMVTLTGELQGKGLSSNLRCLYCEIEKEKVNLEAVSWFQKNKDYYCTLIQHFVYFLGDNWKRITLYIQQNFDTYRRDAENLLDARRLIDVVVTLWLMADILAEFFIGYCRLSDSIIRFEIDTIKRLLIGVVKRSEILSVEEDPAVIFMKTVVSMLESGKILIASERLTTTTFACYDGFCDDNYLYLIPDNIYLKVSAYLRIGGTYFGIAREHLGKMLCMEGYAIPTSNGKSKQVYYARIDIGEGRKVNFLKIPKTVMEKLQKSMDDKE